LPGLRLIENFSSEGFRTNQNDILGTSGHEPLAQGFCVN
jgi:hypothetical protein